MKCHQRQIRDDRMALQPRTVQTSLDGCVVGRITFEEARTVIMEYEWLGTMPTAGLAFYGLFDADDEIIGVVCFGRGSGSNAAALCGDDYRDQAICLERGACVHWAHPHAASFMIPKACKQAAQDFGWKIFYGYSDHEAGEIGTIYQACNWIFIGQGAGRSGYSYRYVYIDPVGEEYNSRRWRKFKTKQGIEWADAEASGWIRRKQYDKSRYVWFEGGRILKKRLRGLLKYPAQPYPKRGIRQPALS